MEEYKNIYNVIKNSAIRLPNKIAIIEQNRSITYQDLLNRIEKLAYWLKNELGIDKGDRIGLMFVNGIDFYIAFYAVMKIGAIGVMINTKMQSEEIAFILEDTQTHCIISNRKWLGKIKDVAVKVGINHVLLDVKAEENIEEFNLISMEEVFNERGRMLEEYGLAVQEDELTAVILHTSGTTGRPKGIMVSHSNMMAAAYGYQSTLRVTEQDITVLSVPIFHILALSCVSNLFLYMGATIVVFEKFNSNQVLEAIEKYHATYFHSVPAVYIKMMNEAIRKYDLNSLRIAVCGGAIISEENKKRFYQMAPNASFHIAYGLTETAGSGTLSYRHGDPCKEVFNCRIKIKDKEGNIVEFGEGEAICEGEIVTTKIWGKVDRGNGQLFTGDIIRKEKNGNIFILDRLKDVINRGGEKLFPSLIENILLKYASVKQAVVFPVEDKVYGELPAAILVPKEGMEIDIAEMKKDLPNKLGKFEVPVYMEVWDEKDIPVTDNGKVRKKEIRTIFEKKLKEGETHEKA